MKKLVKNRFTLVELLVSMAVFSILLVLMMQFFSGARTLWTANEKRTAIYADATVAMDLMSMLLQSTFYSEGGSPFAIRSAPGTAEAAVPEWGWNSKIYFVSNSPMELSKGGSVRYLSFQRKTDPSNASVTLNVLELQVFSDTSNSSLHFDQCFFPFGTNVSSNNNEGEARDYLINTVFAENTPLNSTNERKIILRNVTGLKFTPVDHRGQKIYGPECNDLPAGIEIELSLMENEQTIQDYQALTGTAKDDFRLRNEYVFRRTVWLGDRTVNL